MLTKPLHTLCLGLAFAASLGYATERPLDRIAVIVDDGIIMQSQYEKRLQEVRRTIQSRDAELPPEDILRQQVLDRMILDELQLQIGERSGIRVSDEELNQSIAGLASRNQTTVEGFLRMLTQEGLDEMDVREQIRNEIIINRVRQYRVAERTQVTEQEVKNFLNSSLGKMQLSEDYRLANILIPLSDSPNADEISRTEQAIDSLLKQLEQGADFQQLAMRHSASENALEGGDMGWRKAGQLPPPFDTMVSQMEVGEISQPMRTAGGIIILKLLDKQGSDNIYREETLVRHILIKPSEIRTPEATQQLAQRLYERIRNGEDFAQLARSFSEDPGSALQGGDLGWTDPDTLVSEFRDTMLNTPIGELSRPFASQFGWHILQVQDRRVTDSSQEIREQQALNILHNRKYEEELQLWLREIRDEAYVEIKDL